MIFALMKHSLATSINRASIEKGLSFHSLHFKSLALNTQAIQFGIWITFVHAFHFNNFGNSCDLCVLLLNLQ